MMMTVAVESVNCIIDPCQC